MAVIEHATGTDAEWRMLMLLAGEANRNGIVTDVSMEVLAERMGKSVRGAAGVKGRLKKSGQLVVLEEGGGRGRRAIYWVRLPGLSGPEETPQIGVDTPQPDSPNGDERSRGSKTAEGEEEGEEPKAPKSKAAKERQFHELLGDRLADTPSENGDPEALVDGLELLRRGEKVKGQLVTPIEMAKAAVCIGTFNRCFEWKGREGSDYGLGANLPAIVQRIRERSSWSLDKWTRLVESAWRIRWWEHMGDKDRRPGPPVVFSGNAFENVVQDAAEEAAGEKPAAIRKRRYTRG